MPPSSENGWTIIAHERITKFIIIRCIYWKKSVTPDTDSRLPVEKYEFEAHKRRGGISEHQGDDDQVLVELAQRGDRTAFDRLMLRHQETIAQQMRRFSSDVMVIEELTQTVFIKAYLGLDKYKPNAPVLHWLRAIASRTGYDHWRSEYKNDKSIRFDEREHGATNAANTWMDVPWANSSLDVLARIMPQLRPDEQQTLYMQYIDGMGVAEIAKCMGWNLSMTKMRSFRARRKLRKILQTEGIGLEWLEAKG